MTVKLVTISPTSNVEISVLFFTTRSNQARKKAILVSIPINLLQIFRAVLKVKHITWIHVPFKLPNRLKFYINHVNKRRAYLYFYHFALQSIFSSSSIILFLTSSFLTAHKITHLPRNNNNIHNNKIAL